MTAELDALMVEILMTPEGRADPYPRYEVIREHAPAYRSGIGAVVVGRYAECRGVLRDSRFGQGGGAEMPWDHYGLSAEEWKERFSSLGDGGDSLLGMNPPDHTRLRALVAKAFTPSVVEALRPRITAITDQLLDGFGDEVDVISAFALPLPIAVISEMLGVPASEAWELQPFVRVLVQGLEMTNRSLEELDAMNAASAHVKGRFEELIAARRTHPTEDLLSDLMRVEEEGDRLSHDELIATIVLLFIAGFETTTNLIGNGLFALLDDPAQLERLRREPQLVRTAVDELLRWDAPVQLTGRIALEDAQVAGVDVAKGAPVVILLGAANRDPRQFDRPDVLDVSRQGVQPMSFGSGIHFCLGAALARVEGAIAFSRLLERFSTIEPAWGADRPRYRDAIVLHGLESLPVALRP